jgi:hypothetical protein
MTATHFFESPDGILCRSCGLPRFDETHAIGERDLPVERVACQLEYKVTQLIYDCLAAEHLLPFSPFGQPVDPAFFKKAILPMCHKYLEGLVGELAGVDGPLHAYIQEIRPHLQFNSPTSGFAKHRFSSDERGLLCQQCGMVRANDLHAVRLVV